MTMQKVTEYMHKDPAGEVYFVVWLYNPEDRKYYRMVNEERSIIGVPAKDMPPEDKCRTPYSKAVARHVAGVISTS